MSEQKADRCSHVARVFGTVCWCWVGLMRRGRSLDSVGAAPSGDQGSFYERLAEHGHEIASDDDFADWYADARGRPSVPPSVMVRALMSATKDRASDRESSRRTRVDLDWKAAMGVGDDFEGIGATTFSLFPGSDRGPRR